jgi:clan AA aspartic protease (TIGR02281 family)
MDLARLLHTWIVMIQCPACASYNDGEAAFCGQCGARIEPLIRPRRPVRRPGRLPLLVTLSLLGAMALVAIIALLPEKREPRTPRTVASRGPGSRGVPKDERPGDPAGEVAVRAVLADPQVETITSAQATGAVSRALVVIELRGEDDRPLGEIRGVIVDSRGVVLCRFRPLLGAHQGICRLSSPRDARVEVLGISFREERLDLALLRLAHSAVGYPMVPLLEVSPGDALSPGDPLYLFSDYRATDAVLTEVHFPGPDGVSRMRLAESPRPPAEAFLALDAYGFLLGLARIQTEDGRWVLDGKPPAEKSHRMLVDPVHPAVSGLDLETTLTLQELTRRLYEGTFADYFARGMAAFRQQRWREAIDLLAAGLDRVSLDRPDEDDVARATLNLRLAYLEEIQRLVSANRIAEAGAMAEGALARYPGDRDLLIILGQARCHERNWIGGIQALALARAVEADARVDSLLEQAFLGAAAEASRAGDTREAEARLIEGAQTLLESGAIRIELARLYMRFEAYDDAIQLIQQAEALDPSLAESARLLLDRIDDALKRRDAVVIPIAPESRSIRTDAVIDGVRGCPFIVDTGASFTSIPWDVALALGYDLVNARRLDVTTAGGPISAPLIQVQSVNVGGYSVRNLEVLVLPVNVGSGAGLLGLNFLKHFRYSVDSRRSEFRLERP